MSPESPKDSSLLRLCIYVRPHLLCWTMFNGYLLPTDLILDEKILHLNVLSPLRAACPSVGLEQDSTHVVMVEQGRIHVIVPLLLHKVASPEDIPQ